VTGQGALGWSPRTKAVFLSCKYCRISLGRAFYARCPRCLGPTDSFYDLSRVVLVDDPNPLRRYFDLLPIESEASAIWLGEGNTPCVHAVDLGRAVGLSQLFLKDETKNPTRTTKDRMASVALAFLREHDVNEFVVSSTGNSGTAFGTSVAARPEMSAHIFCGLEFLDRLNVPDVSNVHVYGVAGDYFAAATAAWAFSQRTGIPYEPGFFNPGRREGSKLAYLEALDQMPVEPDVVVQAVSGGMGVYGAYKGFCEYQFLGRLRAMPRIICAQQSRCAPMHAAFAENSTTIEDRHVIAHPEGIAKAILRSNPSDTYPEIYRIVARTNGSIEAVDDSEILEAQALLRDLEGLEACLSSAVALAAVIQLRRRNIIRSDEVVLVNITGADRDPDRWPRPRPSFIETPIEEERPRAGKDMS